MNEKISEINSLKETVQKWQKGMIEKNVVEKVEDDTAGLIVVYLAYLKGLH
jgi:hypothetical protein